MISSKTDFQVSSWTSSFLCVSFQRAFPKDVPGVREAAWKVAGDETTIAHSPGRGKSTRSLCFRGHFLRSNCLISLFQYLSTLVIFFVDHFVSEKLVMI